MRSTPKRLLLLFGSVVLGANGFLLYYLFNDHVKEHQADVGEVFIGKDNIRNRIVREKSSWQTEKQLPEDYGARVETGRAVITTNENKRKNLPRTEQGTTTPDAKTHVGGRETIKGEEDGNGKGVDILPVLVLSCDRTTVKRCLDLLIKYRPSMEHHPIIVSQDCGHEQTAEVIRSYGNQIKFIQQPDLSPIVIDGHVKNKLLTGYYKISRHYKWALSQVFDVFNYKAVIVVEDDLDISVDFYEYFTATRHVLEEDPTLWCVSAWNDNGKQNFIDTTRPDLLYRSDFFPGLGWMLTVSVWNEMRDRWPKAFWDDWMRESAQRKGRACIRPEIPRTDTFGRIGVSRGQFFDKHLKFIVLNSQPVSFNDKDMSYLMKDTYDRQFYSEVYHTPLVSADQLLSGSVDRTVRVEYKNNAEFMQLAQRIGIMADLKDFVPRTAYKGVVSFMFHSHRVYLTRPEGRTEHYTDKPKIRVA